MRKERLENIQKLATNAFKDHTITKKGPGRWVIKRPKSSFYWAEIVSLEGGVLLVHGDIDMVGFARYCPGDMDDDAALAKLRWVAGMGDKPRYAREKVSICMDSDASTVYDADVAKADVKFLIDAYAEDAADESASSIVEQLKIMCREVPHMSEQELWEEIIEITEDSENCENVGRCIRPSVVYAIFAVKKLLDLLDE